MFTVALVINILVYDTFVEILFRSQEETVFKSLGKNIEFWEISINTPKIKKSHEKSLSDTKIIIT